MMTATILDLPMDVLFHIFNMTPGDLLKNQFLRYNPKNKKITSNMKVEPSKRYLRLMKDIQKLFISGSPCILPCEISTIALVSKDFNLVANSLWQHFYVSKLRNGVPYRRTYEPEFYRKKIYGIIKKYYLSLLVGNRCNANYLERYITIENN